MTQSTRRPGFRLPWTGEGEDAPDTTAEAEASATQATTPASSDEPAPGETVVGTIDPGAATAAPDPEPEATAAPAPAAAPEETTDFLRSLVGAMRGVAEEERSGSVGELRKAVDERVAQLEARSGERAEELRRKTELDVTGIGDWAKSEIERINAEAARKVDARRQQLDQQLADHEQRSTGEIESVRERVAAYERELDAFFAQLSAIDDPATFVAAARRMPKPPSLESGQGTPVSTAGSTPTASLDARLAQLGIDRNGAPARTKTEPPAAPAPVVDDTVAAADMTDTPDADTADTADTAEVADETATEVEATATVTEPAEPAEAPTHPTPEAGARDAQLAQRLAELDARTEPNTATTTVAGSDEADEIATAIMVKGLGSFGAITSFKQRLERLATVRSVTLSLGPTGEFVYRATHPREIDLGAAIGTLEPGSTVDRQADGSLRVTVQAR